MDWMLDLKALILGIVQGITEFLPVSSTGHMIIVDEFIKLEPAFKEMFFVVVQLGSIFAVLVYFHKKLFPLGAVHDAALRKSTFLLWCKAAAGVLPAIVIGGLFGSRIQHALYNTVTVASALIIGGIALLWIESVKRRVTVRTTDNLSFGKALAIGLIQCLAMIPGTSRSAATILGSLLLGTSREVAVEYSFFLAIPTMFAASAYSLYKDGSAMDRNGHRFRHGVFCRLGCNCFFHGLHPPPRFQAVRLVPDRAWNHSADLFSDCSLKKQQKRLFFC